MRNFIAVLKDSFREARNGYVLHIFFSLIALVLLICASASFRQSTQQEKLSNDVGGIMSFLMGSPDFGRMKLSVENVKDAQDQDPWNSPYSYDLVVKLPSEKDYNTANSKRLPVSMFQSVRMPTTAAGVKDYYTTLNPAHGIFEVKDLTPVDERPKPQAKDKKEDDGAAVRPVALRYRVDAQNSAIKDRYEWPHEVKLFFVWNTGMSLSLRDIAYYLENYAINGIGSWLFSMLAVIITASFIPNMMQKGAVDLLIAKPIRRWELLLSKYVGGLFFAFLLFVFTVLGIYLLLGLRVGLWSPNFLLAIPVLTFQFAILYAVSTLAGVLSRNAIVAILVTLLFWLGLFAIGKLYDGVRNREREAKKLEDLKNEGTSFNPIDPETGKSISMEEVLNKADPNRPLWGFVPKALFPVIKVTHAVSPRAFQLDYKMGRLIAEGVLTDRQLKERGWDEPPPATWAEVLLVSSAFIGVMLGLSYLRFATRDP